MIKAIAETKSKTVEVHFQLEDGPFEQQANQYLEESNNIIVSILGTAYERYGIEAVNFCLDEINRLLPEIIEKMDNEDFIIRPVSEQNILPS